MEWNPKETLACVSGAVIRSFLSGNSLASPEFSALAGSIVEAGVKGISVHKERTPDEKLQKIIEQAVQNALSEARRSDPFELPAGCENKLIEDVLSADNAVRYMAAPDPERLFEETITDILSSYCECDTESLPIKQISGHILHQMEIGIRKDWQVLILYNQKLSQNALWEIRELKELLDKSGKPSCPDPKIRERSALRLKKCRSAARFSYYNQRIDPSIVPKMKADHALLTISELMPWLERQGIKRIQLIGEGGTGKTSLLLSLWEYLIANDQYAGYYVNMVKLNQINNKSKEEAERFLLTEFAREFLFDDSYLNESRMNDAVRMLAAGTQAKSPQYVLLLDGFNEVLSDYQTILIRQLNELEHYQNVTGILTSRFKIGPRQLSYDLFPVWVSELDTDTIQDYLEKHGKEFPESFGKLLDNPMMLTVYCETDQLSQENSENRFFSFPQKIENKYDLMRAFFEGLACKEYNLDGDLDNLVRNLFIYNYVLPYIASEMGGSYACSYQEVKDCIERICDLVHQGGPAVNAAFLERDLDRQWKKNVERPDLCETIRKHLLENPTVFVGSDSRDKDASWMFIHQEYRDYCGFKYAAICLEKVLKEEGCTAELSEDQRMSAILKIRNKLRHYPNLYWLEILESIEPERVDSYHCVGSTNIYEIMKAVAHARFRRIDAVQAFLKQMPNCLPEKFLFALHDSYRYLIDYMDFQSILVGTSNFTEVYLDTLLDEGNEVLTNHIVEKYRVRLEEVVDELAQRLKEEEICADFDIQLPSNRQIDAAKSVDDWSELYKIIILCKGPLNRLYAILGIVHDLYRFIPGAFKDYVDPPKLNGYRALHTVVNAGEDVFIEVIIRETRKLRAGW